jgi:hypothetical protein
VSESEAPPPPGRIRRAGELIVRHEGLAITLAYLGLIALGMFHSALYFNEFGVNIVDFAEVSDFLLAPVRDPLVVLVSILPLLIVWVYRRMTLAAVDRWPRALRFGGRDRSPRMAWVWGFAALLWVVAFNMHYVNWLTDRIKAGEGTAVAAAFTDGSPVGGGTAAPLLLLRGTSKFAFFYRPVERQVVIVPIEGLSRIVVQRPAPRLAETPHGRP